MGREFELKYQANTEKLSAIQEKFQSFTAIAMETAYYDTPSAALSEKCWMLRLRQENGRKVCTLKTPLPDGSRGEWETEAPSIAAGIDALCKLGAPQELSALTCGGVTQTCAARFTRLAALISLPECTVELALDQGVLLGGGKTLPFAEVEAELKAGSEAAAAVFAQALAREFDLQPEPRSKLQRAMALLEPSHGMK